MNDIVRTFLILTLWATLAWGTVCADTSLDSVRDPRLNRPVQAEAASITLGELAKAVQRQTQVMWRVPDRWREVRLTVYAPQRPLKELMEGVAAALPVLEWRVREADNHPIEYFLHQVSNLQDTATFPNRALHVEKLRRMTQLLQLYLKTSGEPPQSAERFSEQERRAVEALLARLNRPHSELLLHHLDELTFRTGVEWLLQLTDADWQTLQQQGALTRWFSSRNAFGVTVLERVQMLAGYYRQFDESEFFRKEAKRLEQITEMLGELRLTDAGELYFYLAPAEQAARRLKGSPHSALLLSLSENNPFATLPEIPTITEWYSPLPSPLPAIRQQANWYNELGCLMLELAHAARRPLIAPLFPFHATGDTPAFTQLYANTLVAHIAEFRLPNRDLPRLLALASLNLKLHGEWLIAQHTHLARAYNSDISDSHLRQWFLAQPLQGTEWLRLLLDSLASLDERSRPMLHRRLVFSRVEPVYERISRYPLSPQSPPLQWGFRVAQSIQVRQPSGVYETLMSYSYAEDRLTDLLEFWRAMPRGMRLRALSGVPVEAAELPAPARIQFVELFRRTEFLSALIEGSLGSSALFRIEYRPTPAECAVPDKRTQSELLQTDDPIAAWSKWYYQVLSEAEPKEVLQERLAPAWVIQFEWGNWRIEYQIQRAVCGEWLAAPAGKSFPN